MTNSSFFGTILGLRDHQIVSSYPPPPPTDYERAAMQAPSPSGSQDYQSANRNLDPAMGGASAIMNAAGDSGGDETSGDGRKGFGKRELSTSKRAAQNRAAQVRETATRPWLIPLSHCPFHPSFAIVHS